MDARATCRTALLDKPSDQPLTKLYAELLEQAEDWGALGRALEQLANLTIETREQAHWLTRAAQVHLDHGDHGGHGADGRESMVAARRLLERARAVSLESTEAQCHQRHARSVAAALVALHEPTPGQGGEQPVGAGLRLVQGAAEGRHTLSRRRRRQVAQTESYGHHR